MKLYEDFGISGNLFGNAGAPRPKVYMDHRKFGVLFVVERIVVALTDRD